MKKLVVYILVMLSLSNYAATALLDHELEKARKHIDQGKWNSAINELENIARSFRDQPQETAEIKVMIASCQNSAGQYVAALKTLSGTNSFMPSQFRLEEARAYLGLGNYAKAMDSTKYYGKESGVSLEMSAAWVKAQAQMQLGQFRECMGSCGSIMWRELKADPKGLADMKISEATYKKLQAMKEPAAELYYDAREAYDIKVYGIDFALYRKAREAQFRGDYKKAIELYEKIKGGTLKEAAGCYIGECYIALGDNPKAVKIYTKMIKASPYELYREEIMYKLAIIYYLENHLAGSLKITEELREWFKKVEADVPKVELKAINEALQRDIIAPAPKTYVKADDCGNLFTTIKYPESINNRLTTPWYLPSLKVKTELFYGFLLGEKRQKPQAASVFDNAESISDMQIVTDKYALFNLKAGLAEGSYLLSKTIMRKVKKYDNQIRLSAFYYTCDERAKAKELFDLVIRNAGTQYNDDVLAARVGKIYCLLAEWNDAEALKEIEPLLKIQNADENPMVLEAKYLKACVLARSKNTMPQSLTIFQELSTKRKNSVADKALLAMALTAVNNGKQDMAKSACKTLCSKFGSSPFSKPARTLAAALGQREKGSKLPIGIIETNNGKVVLHRRVITMPCTVDWRAIHADLSSSDIIVYNLKMVPKNNCEIVRSVWMRLDPGEPSPPDAIGDEIYFVRAPVLFEKSLLYDLRNIETK